MTIFLSYDDYKRMQSSKNYELLSLSDIKRYELDTPKTWSFHFLQDSDDLLWDFFKKIIHNPSESYRMIQDLKTDSNKNDILDKIVSYITHNLEMEDYEHLIPLIFHQIKTSFLVSDDGKKLVKKAWEYGIISLSEMVDYPDTIITCLTPEIYNHNKEWLQWYFGNHTDYQSVEAINRIITLTQFDVFFETELKKHQFDIQKHLLLWTKNTGSIIPSRSDAIFPLWMHVKPMFSMESRLFIFHYFFKRCSKNMTLFTKIDQLITTWIPEYSATCVPQIADAFLAYTQQDDTLSGLEQHIVLQTICHNLCQKLETMIPNPLASIIHQWKKDASLEKALTGISQNKESFALKIMEYMLNMHNDKEMDLML